MTVGQNVLIASRFFGCWQAIGTSLFSKPEVYKVGVATPRGFAGPCLEVPKTRADAILMNICHCLQYCSGEDDLARHIKKKNERQHGGKEAPVAVHPQS